MVGGGGFLSVATVLWLAGFALAAPSGVNVRVASVVQTVPVPGPIVGEVVPVVVRLVNDGDAAAGPFSVALWKDQIAEPTGPDTADAVEVVEGLAVGEDGAVEVTFEVEYGQPGTYTVWVWADAGQQTGDTNPADNKYSILLTVVEDLPDVIITGIEADRHEPKAGQPFHILVTVSNQGRVEAGAFRVALWQDRLTPPMDAGDADAEAQAEAIPGGETGTVLLPVEYESGGTYRVWVMVDTAGEVAEVNEDNNRAYIELVVQSRGIVGEVIHGMCGGQGADGLAVFGLMCLCGLGVMKAAGGRDDKVCTLAFFGV